MNKKIVKILISIIVVLVCSVVLIQHKNRKYIDTVSYNGNTYVYLEYNMDVFYYDFNGNNYYEEDIIYPISHDKWDIVYFNGDLFVRDDQVKKAKEYYSKDDNYEWFFTIDVEDTEIEYPISLSQNELDFLYNLENIEKEETMLFEEIKEFGSIKKVSKDKMISALITLAYYKNSWYWKTEIIDVTKENDPEYVIKLPDSLNNKISDLLKK